MLNGLTATDVAILVLAFMVLRPYFDRRTLPLQAATAPAPPPPVSSTALEELMARLVGLETEVRGLPSLWATERERIEEQTDIARRAAARIAQAQRRLEERSAESSGEPELELGPVHPEVRSSNGTRGHEGLVLPMRADLAAAVAGVPPHKLR